MGTHDTLDLYTLSPDRVVAGSGVAGETTVAPELSVVGDCVFEPSRSKLWNPDGAWITDCGSSLAESDRTRLGKCVFSRCGRS